MPQFSAASTDILVQLHPELQRWLTAFIKKADFKIVEGPRTLELQEIKHAAGLSKTPPTMSKHLRVPCEAVHLLPYPWGKTPLDSPAGHRRLCYFAGLAIAEARAVGVTIRWGGDWDRDNDTTDQTFNDLMHFEIIV